MRANGAVNLSETPFKISEAACTGAAIMMALAKSVSQWPFRVRSTSNDELPFALPCRAPTTIDSLSSASPSRAASARGKVSIPPRNEQRPGRGVPFAGRDFMEFWKRGAQAQLFRIARINPRNEWTDDPVQQFIAEFPAHERGDGFVG